MGEERLPIAPEAPAVMEALNTEREEYWRHVDNSVNAVSFGFVATAILISMFLLMAIFEKFLRSRSSSSSSSSHNNNNSPTNNITRLDIQNENHIVYGRKLDYPSPKMSVYSRGVSVLMPGENTPTFIAHHAPAPSPCPPEGILRPFHSTQNNEGQQYSFNNGTSPTQNQI
ncbi:hypothetical protein CsatA_016885 [Cannabis sativa]